MYPVDHDRILRANDMKNTPTAMHETACPLGLRIEARRARSRSRMLESTSLEAKISLLGAFRQR
jgi:hypothetical protein